MTTLPRLSVSLGSIVDSFGVPTNVFTRFWDGLCTAIEGALDSLETQQETDESLLQQLQATQAQQAAQLVLINQALATANKANASTGGGNEQTASGTVDLTTTSTWQPGPTVSFTTGAAPSAVTVTLGSSGPNSPGNCIALGGELEGQVRLQQIVAGVETTLASATFSVDPPTPARGGDPAIPAQLNWGDFSSYSAAYTPPASSTVQYRCDIERTSGATSTGVGVVTDVVWK